MPVSMGSRVPAGRVNGAPAVSVDPYFNLSLLGLVSSGFLAVVSSGHLDWYAILIAGAGLLFRALVVAGVVRVAFPRNAGLLVTVAFLGLFGADYLLNARDFLPSVVHLVVFLAVIQVLAARTTRDHVFVAATAFLELIAASLLSPDISFFAFLVLFLVFGVATFASGEIRRSARKQRHIARGGLRRFHWRLGALTLAASFGILLLTGGMFFILPRTARAAFQHLIPDRYHIPGFSNEMRLGEIGEISQSRIPVMHVRFFGEARPPQNLKWRGNALTQFDGKRWYNPPQPAEVVPVQRGAVLLADNPQRWREGLRLLYEVRLHSVGGDALFFTGTPEFLRVNLPSVIRNREGGIRAGYGQTENLHYGAQSFVEESALPSATYKPVLTESERIHHLLLPRIDPRIIELARKLTEGAESADAKAKAIERYFHNNFEYTTELLPKEVPDPLANFLFERRKGHCEYFSSAMAVMLRAVNVPARIANGFQSGIYNPLSGWTVIRASDAHSWVEAWVPGRGWTTYDPTPPASRSGLGLVSRIGLYLDAAETFWHEWILNYDLDRQLVLASQMETSGRTFGSRWAARLGERFRTARALLAEALRRWGVYAVLLAVAGFAVRRYGPALMRNWRTARRVRQVRRGDALASDATLLYERMLGTLKRRGFTKPAWSTPNEFAGQLPASETSALVAVFTKAYNDLRYGGDRTAAPRLVELLAELERR